MKMPPPYYEATGKSVVAVLVLLATLQRAHIKHQSGKNVAKLVFITSTTSTITLIHRFNLLLAPFRHSEKVFHLGHTLQQKLFLVSVLVQNQGGRPRITWLDV